MFYFFGSFYFIEWWASPSIHLMAAINELHSAVCSEFKFPKMFYIYTLHATRLAITYIDRKRFYLIGLSFANGKNRNT